MKDLTTAKTIPKMIKLAPANWDYGEWATVWRSAWKEGEGEGSAGERNWLLGFFWHEIGCQVGNIISFFFFFFSIFAIRGSYWVELGDKLDPTLQMVDSSKPKTLTML